MFIESWKIAFNTLHLKDRLAREQALRDLMYKERIEGLANMVVGVAHEINTPLGVANTANSMIPRLLGKIRNLAPVDPALDKAFGSLEEVSTLMTKNIVRAHRLVESFTKLSVSQVTDQRTNANICSILRECFEVMRPVTSRMDLAVQLHTPTDALQWDGYAGALSQVIINLIQNTVRYAYPRVSGGKVEARVFEDDSLFDGGGFRLEFEDYGKGIAPELLSRVFEPFVTTGRETGGTGLGLAISRNIVTDLLHGRIHCESQVGIGTKFVIELPRVVPK